MIRIFGALLLFLLSSASPVTNGYAQSSHDLFGSARAASLGHGTTALSTTVGVHANPAAGAAHGERSVSFYVREGFGLSVLRYGAVFGTWPTSLGTFSTGASTFGSEAYRETHLTLGYARPLSLGTTRSTNVGLTARYYHTSIEGYGNNGALGIHLGMLLPLLPSLQFGAHATNVNNPSLVEGELLPQTLSVGLTYKADSEILVVADVIKDLDFPVSMRGGIEVYPISILALRAGLTTTPTQFAGGVGLRLNHLHADLAAEQHLELGWSPSASLRIDW